MNIVRPSVAGLLSTKASTASWLAILIGGGGLLMNAPSMILGRRELISTYCGLALALCGLVLAVRFYVVRARTRFVRKSSPTKAL